MLTDRFYLNVREKVNKLLLFYTYKVSSQDLKVIIDSVYQSQIFLGNRCQVC